MKREEIFQYVKEQYGTEPEYLWKKDPDSAVLRHKNQENNHLLRMLDRGIDDMEAGRELPLEDAFRKITELRDARRNARI